MPAVGETKMCHPVLSHLHEREKYYCRLACCYKTLLFIPLGRYFRFLDLGLPWPVLFLITSRPYSHDGYLRSVDGSSCSDETYLLPPCVLASLNILVIVC